jgi:hypothetical protein
MIVVDCHDEYVSQAPSYVLDAVLRLALDITHELDASLDLTGIPGSHKI